LGGYSRDQRSLPGQYGLGRWMEDRIECGAGVPLLCQPDNRKGCAWCCGLYNVRGSGRDELARRLRRRTERFSRAPRTVGGILRYAAETKGEEHLELVDPDFYSCEFVGFLNREKTRVGCLLNARSPGNGGVDWRGLSFHGGSACSGFFCRAFRELTEGERKIIVGSVDDWYLYGSLISDIEYIKGVFGLVEEALGRFLDPEWMLQPDATSVVLEFFRWKTDPPFPGEVDSKADGEADFDRGIARAEGKRAPITMSHLDRVLETLGCRHQSVARRQCALDLVNRLLARLCEIPQQVGSNPY